MSKSQKGKILIDVNDIVGKRVGELKVVSYFGYIYRVSRGGIRLSHYYLCQCDCGNVNFIRRSSLKNEKVHSCGHCGHLYTRRIPR